MGTKTICKIFLVLVLCCPAALYAQNVGIGTSTPTEKLDVNGNINVTGTIKANGVDGTPNQVLMKNASGNLVWGDMTEYKKFETFVATGSHTWTVPAGVTKIFIEAWGAGGGGSGFSGGGGGGYVAAYFTVTPGSTVSLYVGIRGTGGNNGTTDATNGESSTASVGTVTITAHGGLGSVLVGSSVLGAVGGGFSVTPSTFRNFRGIPGESGHPNQMQYFQSNSTTFLEATVGGRGGNAGNADNSGGGAGYRLFSLTASTTLRYVSPGSAKIPGGGGGGNYASASSFGSNGASGMVRIHY